MALQHDLDQGKALTRSCQHAIAPPGTQAPCFKVNFITVYDHGDCLPLQKNRPHSRHCSPLCGPTVDISWRCHAKSIVTFYKPQANVPKGVLFVHIAALSKTGLQKADRFDFIRQIVRSPHAHAVLRPRPHAPGDGHGSRQNR